MINGLFTNIGIFFLKILARLPLGILYILSDLFFVIIYYTVGYRRNVVIKNLSNAFPDKDVTEIKQIARKFFRHFCDLTLETIKLSTIKETELKQRMKIENAEVIDQFTKKGRSVTVLAMHYANWEWATFIASALNSKTFAVYKPLHNLRFDRYMNKNRSRFGADLVKNSQILRRVINADKENKPVVIWLAGDQTPPPFHDTWFLFFKQEAIFYLGPALIARRFNTPVVFQFIEKISRGNYRSRFELLVENPAAMNENEIIKTYIRKMEEVIEKNPEFYLWSHKRWKHKRDKGVPLYD